MIHFVIGDSVAGTLKLAFRGKDHQIYALPLDLSVGPTAAIHEEEGIRRHFDWLKSSFIYEDDELAHQEEKYRQTLIKLKSLKDGEQVTIWTSENAAEQIGLRLACYLTADRKLELSVVKTPEAMDELMRGSAIQIEVRHSGEFNAKQLSHFYEHSRTRLSEATIGTLTQDAERLLASPSLLRSLQDGEILEAEETRDDQFILDCVREQEEENAKDGFVKAVRVVGEVLGHSYHIYSDAWIDYRLRSLIHSGKVLARGDLGSMRSYEVRAVEK
ncbi:DUF1835 domain-containing protein [Metaplanococcus flavidus]|uniref:DUF1835 domain-containing protein n=1 Tax=Metaplanococcus flavidus TaxID=569883 RepID=A0ABW3LAA4_9BACL